MSTICFLLDEHVPPFIQAQLARLEPNLRVYMIGDDLAPVRGTPDPGVLLWIEATAVCWSPIIAPPCRVISQTTWLSATMFLASFSCHDV